MAQPAPTATPTPPAPATEPAPESPLAAPDRVPRFTYAVVNTYPHDTDAYTQGLQFVDGLFYEGTGRHGASSLRRVEIETGKVLQKHDLAEEFFGEGIAVVGDRIWQLTWQEQTAFLYDREGFIEIQRVSYPTQGWGLTYDGSRLIMSDGTDTLYFRDPATFEETGRVAVRYLDQPLATLNELEFIDGEVWANLYQTDFIARIDPESGNVTGVVDLTGLLNTVTVMQPVDVLNGIAWDAEGQRLFVTGKWWPAVFEITLRQEGYTQ